MCTPAIKINMAILLTLCLSSRIMAIVCMGADIELQEPKNWVDQDDTAMYHIDQPL